MSSTRELREALTVSEDENDNEDDNEDDSSEEELAAAKSNMLDNPSVLSHTLKEVFAVAAINNFYGWSSPLQYRTRNTAFTASGVQKVKLSRTCATLINPNALKNASVTGMEARKQRT
ncbi:hypothetical protein DAPPUDRAFT_266467 [Daphnia pulex]|uniref:Uncharacterized protein n=1 Tax=Daphnia pulex TaxID=6669 RepID=E9HV24_DAPPU|nr:hypothetical protein DAPPUDRAFT_266467 [Daphnia pulex]|eukprot:EFX64408.1 hypothetical protein DAPPUDRAFT_266467 [Daphnia pulex]